MQPEAFFEVELRIFRRTMQGYTVSFRSWYGEEVMTEFLPPPEELFAAQLDPRQYGILAFNWLFRDHLVADAFWKARSAAGVPPGASFLSTEGGLRLRLWLDDIPPHLAPIRWEALQAPDDYLPLSLCTAFSRYKRVRVRAGPAEQLFERPLRILQILAQPTDLETFGLPPLDPALGSPTERLISSPFGSMVNVDRLEGPITLGALKQRLEHGYHVAYVVAHTVLRGDRQHIMLANKAGHAQLVDEETLSAVLGFKTRFPPQLVILALPLTQREATGVLHLGLMERLIEAGVQSVITSELPQENRKLQAFNETFFKTLMQTGVIDIAVTHARAEIFDTQGWDWSYPVLVTRNRDTQLFAPLDLTIQQQIDQVVKGSTILGAVIDQRGTPDDEVRHG